MAGEGKGGAGKAEDNPAMADVMAVDHVVAHDHAHLRMPWTDLVQHHAERPGRVVLVIHGAPDRLRETLLSLLAHQRPLNLAGRFARKAATPSRKSSERAAARCRSRST